MIPYTVFNKETDEIIRTGVCSNSSFTLQAGKGEDIIKQTINFNTQKILNGKIVDKTPEEIKAEEIAKEAERKRAEIPHEKQQAHITNEQYQSLLIRLTKLENISKENT